MPIPRFNYYPPAGEVIDQTDPRVTWDGRAWKLNGRVYGVPSSHRLIGRPGSSHSGWYYDWGRRAWMQPDPRPAPGPRPSPGPRPGPFGPVGPIRPQPQPQPQPAPQPPAPKAPEKKETDMNKNMLDALIKHPVAPVLGGLLLVASHLTDEPQPPPIPDDLPDATAKQWQMIFNQNQQRFARRMQMYQHLGMVLLGYAEAQTVIGVLGPKKAA
jgi:hypothetical protein